MRMKWKDLKKNSLICVIVVSLIAVPLYSQEPTEIELLNRIVAEQTAQIEKQKIERDALSEIIRQQRSIILAKDQQIEEWKDLAGAKTMSRGEKFRLGLTIAGSVAAIVGATLRSRE